MSHNGWSNWHTWNCYNWISSSIFDILICQATDKRKEVEQAVKFYDGIDNIDASKVNIDEITEAYNEG